MWEKKKSTREGCVSLPTHLFLPPRPLHHRLRHPPPPPHSLPWDPASRVPSRMRAARGRPLPPQRGPPPPTCWGPAGGEEAARFGSLARAGMERAERPASAPLQVAYPGSVTRPASPGMPEAGNRTALSAARARSRPACAAPGRLGPGQCGPGEPSLASPLPRGGPQCFWPRPLPAAPAPPRRRPHRGCAREGRRCVEVARGRGPRAARSLSLALSLSPLLRINKIFKMAVREAEREGAGQSARGAGSWRAREGGREAGRRRLSRAARAGSRGVCGPREDPGRGVRRVAGWVHGVAGGREPGPPR